MMLYKKDLKTGKSSVCDGWHTVRGFKVHVEAGRIIRAMRKDYCHGGGLLPAYPYRFNKKTGAWDYCPGVKVSTFRNSDLYAIF